VSILPFTSDKQLLDFAREFVIGRLGGFRKDTNICLTKDRNGRHAYFPALLTCISVLDLLSGLYSGDLRKAGLPDLKKYVARFMDKKKYSRLNLEVLYVAFRHKLSHHSHPYFVLDTATDTRISKKMRLTWTVAAGWRALPIEIRSEPGKYLKKSLHPWKVGYDHRVFISIPHFRNDIIESAIGPNGYLKALSKSPLLRSRCAKCMVEFFPP
jgi:hypothetical protein